MYKFLSKNGQTLAFLLGVVVVGIFLISVISGLSTWNPNSDNKYETGIFNFGLTAARLLIIVAALGMLVFGLFHVVTNIKGSIKGIIGFAILLAIFFIAFNSASGEAEPFIRGAVENFEGSQNVEMTPNNLKFIGGGISTAIILAAIAAAAFVLSEIRNLFK
jgi:hypothetical protein